MTLLKETMINSMLICKTTGKISSGLADITTIVEVEVVGETSTSSISGGETSPTLETINYAEMSSTRKIGIENTTFPLPSKSQQI